MPPLLNPTDDVDGKVAVSPSNTAQSIISEPPALISPSSTSTTTSTAPKNAGLSSSQKVSWAILFLILIALVSVVVVPSLRPGAKDNNKSSNNSDSLVAVALGPSELPLVGSGVPTMTPSTYPTLSPTVTASASPTSGPSTPPPTTSPTMGPTMTPTSRPTLGHIPVNPVPNDPPSEYFNYDINDDEYGPKRWNRVNTQRSFMREFGSNGWGAWKNRFSNDPENNQCGSDKKRQSPKDLYSTFECDAGHEIRTWCGQGAISSDTYERQILPHKLSLKMPRRPCLQVEDGGCDNVRPPIADFPRYSSSASSYSDLLNYDIKIPGEHTLEGVSFDAEIQMLHVHPGEVARMGSIGIPVRATNNVTGYNSEFQMIINQFQLLYDSHAQACGAGGGGARRNLRQRDDDDDNNNNDKDDEDKAPIPDDPVVTTRPNKFDPYQPALMPTMFFYRYDGSITEPPCKDITWWVMMEPMIISVRQLDQLKTILFTHVDPEQGCQRTSVHNEDQSVARPLYDVGDREIQKCDLGEFRSDLSKGRPPGNKCNA